MRVISGKLKSVEIPFEKENFDNANATPQKIKKALFSILGEDLTGKSFLDLYSGSGQIGMEALSRNAELVVFNEIDKKRFHFIGSIIKKWKLDDSSLIFNFHAFRCMRYLDSRNINFDCIFIDPPYSKKNIDVNNYSRIMEELYKYGILKAGGKIIIQHLSKIKINSAISEFRYKGTKKYAKNSLSVFERAGK